MAEYGSNEIIQPWDSALNNISVPDPTIIANGWLFGLVADSPYMNFVNNRADKQINYLMRSGVPEWNSNTPYVVGDWCSLGGELYTCIEATDIVGKNPTTNPTNWEKGSDDGNNVKLTGNQTVAGVKTFTSNPLSTATQSTTPTALTRHDFVTGLDAQNVKLTGNQTITGTKTFNGTINGTAVQSGIDTTADKILKTGSFGVGSQAIHPSSDFDEIAESGFWLTEQNMTNAPLVSSERWNVFVVGSDTSDYGTQIATLLDATTTNPVRSFVRYSSGGVWSAWSQVSGGGSIGVIDSGEFPNAWTSTGVSSTKLTSDFFTLNLPAPNVNGITDHTLDMSTYLGTDLTPYKIIWCIAEWNLGGDSDGRARFYQVQKGQEVGFYSKPLGTGAGYWYMSNTNSSGLTNYIYPIFVTDGIATITVQHYSQTKSANMVLKLRPTAVSVDDDRYIPFAVSPQP